MDGGLKSNKVNVVNYERIIDDHGQYDLFAKNCTPKEFFEYLGSIMKDGIAVSSHVASPAPNALGGQMSLISGFMFDGSANTGAISYDFGTTRISDITAITYNGETYVGNFVPSDGT